RPGRELAHLAGADEQDTASRQIAEHLLGQRGSRGRDRRGALVDRGLGPHLLADPERLAEQPVEHRTVGSRLVGVAYLAEDLTLAGNERVDPGRDPEQVQP